MCFPVTQVSCPVCFALSKPLASCRICKGIGSSSVESIEELIALSLSRCEHEATKAPLWIECGFYELNGLDFEVDQDRKVSLFRFELLETSLFV